MNKYFLKIRKNNYFFILKIVIKIAIDVYIDINIFYFVGIRSKTPAVKKKKL